MELPSGGRGHFKERWSSRADLSKGETGRGTGRPYGGSLFVCLLGFNVRAAIFQQNSDDEHEIDDKMIMK